MPAMQPGMGSLAGPARGGIARGVTKATSILVVGEVALAVVLLFGAGLVLRSFDRLLSIDPGFRADHVLALDFAIPTDRYPDEKAGRAFFDRATAAISS